MEEKQVVEGGHPSTHQPARLVGRTSGWVYVAPIPLLVQQVPVLPLPFTPPHFLGVGFPVTRHK